MKYALYWRLKARRGGRLRKRGGDWKIVDDIFVRMIEGTICLSGGNNEAAKIQPECLTRIHSKISESIWGNISRHFHVNVLAEKQRTGIFLCTYINPVDMIDLSVLMRSLTKIVFEFLTVQYRLVQFGFPDLEVILIRTIATHFVLVIWKTALSPDWFR